MKVGQAARFKVPAHEHALDHHVYIHDGGTDWCVFLCETYEFAFSVGWGAVGSVLCVELFSRAWSAATGSAPQRLDTATTGLVDGFCHRSASIWPVGSDPLETAAQATFLAAARGEDGAIHIRWMGNQIAMLVRARAPVRWTKDHTLGTVLATRGHDRRQIPHARVITRSIASDMAPEKRLPDSAVWADLERGDHLVIASGELLEHVTLPEVAALFAPGAPPSMLAERIVDMIAQRGDPYGVAVCVVAL